MLPATRRGSGSSTHPITSSAAIWLSSIANSSTRWRGFEITPSGEIAMRVERLRRTLPVIIGLALFIAALEGLPLTLRTVSWHTLSADIFSTPLSRLGLALALTALNYAALTGYDLLAFVYTGKRLPYRQIAMVSFLAYAIANNVGF